MPRGSGGSKRLTPVEAKPESAAAEPDAAGDVDTPEEAVEEVGSAPEVVVVRMRRTAKCGDGELLAGEVLGELHLAGGVDVNYFVDAVRNGLAGAD